MTEKTLLNRGTRILINVAALIVIIAGINQARSVLVSMLVAVFLAVIATSPVQWLERRKIPAVASVLLVVFGLVLLLVLIGAIVGVSLNGLTSKLPLYQRLFEEDLSNIHLLLERIGIRNIGKMLIGYANPGAIMSVTTRMLTELGMAFTNMILILLTVTFILLEASTFPIKLRAILGHPQNHPYTAFKHFFDDIKRYMFIKSLISLATGILIAIWLEVLGVDFPLLWGFLAFLLTYVPNIGSTVAAIPAVFLAFIQFGIAKAGLTAAGYILINFVLFNLFETRYMGQKLGLSTLVVFLSLIFWGSLLGPIGMVLCIPFTIALKYACAGNDETRWIATLLGREPVIENVSPKT
jgi:AI-2 transport protein TqsA